MFLTYGRQANRLWRNNGDGTFTDVAVETTFDGDDIRNGKVLPGMPQFPPWMVHGNNFDCAVADFNCDGNMDCFLGEICHWWAGPSCDKSMLLVNRGPKHKYKFLRDPGRIFRRHDDPQWNEGDISVGWLDVGNHFLNIRLSGQAIGARATVWTGDHRQTQEVYGGHGHAGHRDDSDLRFGLGKARRANKVEIRWPDAENTTQLFKKVWGDRFYQLAKGEEIKPVAFGTHGSAK